MKKKFTNQKVKCSFSINGMDLHAFKELTREQRTTPSIKVGQFIHEYLQQNRGEEKC